MDGDRAAPHPPARPAGQHGPQYAPPVAGASEPAVAVALMALVAVIAVVLPAAGAHMGVVHQIPEGHVGVYWRGGALLKHVTEPARVLVECAAAWGVSPYGWQVGGDCDRAEFIACDANGLVTAMWARMLGPSGSIPRSIPTALVTLTSLTSLSLIYNDLEGPIPASISGLTSLSSL
ncbi:unnamed protein product [Closterium sp. NIES-54]